MKYYSSFDFLSIIKKKWTKVHIVKVMVFPVVMYKHEAWTIKKVSVEELMLSNCGPGED